MLMKYASPSWFLHRIRIIYLQDLHLCVGLNIPGIGSFRLCELLFICSRPASKITWLPPARQTPVILPDADGRSEAAPAVLGQVAAEEKRERGERFALEESRLLDCVGSAYSSVRSPPNSWSS